MRVTTDIAVFVMGADEGLAWLMERPGYEGFVIAREDRTVSTPGLASLRSSATRPLPMSPAASATPD